MPKTVKTLRASAWHNMKALGNIFKNVLRDGLLKIQVQEGDRFVGLAWGNTSPPTLVLHGNEGSPGFAMLWFCQLQVAFYQISPCERYFSQGVE